jgi:hypothetical protein
VADVIAASELLAAGDAKSVLQLIPNRGVADALLLHLRAEALELLGRDASAEWELLARPDSASALVEDLAGHAAIRLATLAAARGEDPRPALARVPARSRYASRARHMAALATLERGDTAFGKIALEKLLATDSTYAGRRDVLRTLGGLALDRGDWERAYQFHLRAEAEWKRARAALRERLSPCRCRRAVAGMGARPVAVRHAGAGRPQRDRAHRTVGARSR